MRVKKLIGICMLGAAMLVLSGCGAKNAEDQDVIRISIGQSNNPGEPFAEAADYWAEILEKESGGTMIMTHYPSDQLGSKTDLFDQMIAGDAVIAPGSSPFFSDLGVADFGIVQAPYLCSSWEEMEKLMASDWYADLEKKLEKKGYKVIARNWRYGARHTLTKSLVEHPEDLKGMKIRVPDSTPYVKTFEAIGANPTPLTMNEIYTALQQGTIDGLENPLTTIVNGGWQEVAKYILLDGHILDMTSMVCGLDFWNGLTAKQQEILQKTAEEAGEYQNRLMEEAESQSRKALEEAGVQFTEVDVEEFRAASENYYTYKEFSNWTPGLYDTVKNILAEEEDHENGVG
ncbi:MAG: TRAP transporter substrate-binding protein DctP [Blautia sp.]|jgi:tripartite ATP-independent transporter DctP family solute receptor